MGDQDMIQTTIAVCGTDTGVGKTMATGLLAGFLQQKNCSVITQKPVQTGCAGKPEDLLVHRKLMGTSWNAFDEQGLTCPYCFPFPSSPHLAAALAGKTIDPEVITTASTRLAATHDVLLVEGVGGLLVPLTPHLLLLDYLQQCGYPMILVTSAQLGSLNHTLLALEALQSRQVLLLGLVYNLHGDNPVEIVRDSLQVFKRALGWYGMSCPVLLLPDAAESTAVNWQPILDRLPAA